MLHSIEVRSGTSVLHVEGNSSGPYHPPAESQARLGYGPTLVLYILSLQ